MLTITLESKDGLYEATLYEDPIDAYNEAAWDPTRAPMGYEPGVGRHPTRTGAISNAFLSYRQLNGKEAE